MRRLAELAILATISVHAQIVGVLIPRPPNEVREYLGLTQEQSRALDLQWPSYWSGSKTLRDTWETLQPQILEETKRSPLRPAELGRLHAERERARRLFRSQEIEWMRTATAILTETQIAKLRVLAEWAGRGGWRDTAISMGLLSTECLTAGLRSNASDPMPEVCQAPYIPMITSIPDWSVDKQGEAKRESAEAYLGLSKEQKDQIEANRRRSYTDSGVNRMRQVAREIREELARETLDEAAIGIRYAEMESLRRKETELTRKQTAENVAVLRPEQKVKLDALREAMRLTWAVSDARSEGLLGGRCEDNGVIFFDSNPISMDLFFYYLGDCPDKRALSDLP